jgi:O6-methylguanine-DNA--protein-cysteine methyltransferase
MAQAIQEMGPQNEGVSGWRRQGNPPAYLGQIGDSPIGAIWVAVADGGLSAVEIGADLGDFEEALKRRGYRPVLAGNSLLTAAMQQISEYLSGTRHDFDLPIDWSGMTDFQEKVITNQKIGRSPAGVGLPAFRS